MRPELLSHRNNLIASQQISPEPTPFWVGFLPLPLTAPSKWLPLGPVSAWKRVELNHMSCSQRRERRRARACGWSSSSAHGSPASVLHYRGRQGTREALRADPLASHIENGRLRLLTVSRMPEPPRWVCSGINALPSTCSSCSWGRGIGDMPMRDWTWSGRRFQNGDNSEQR